jgi:hypothetical protein
MTENFIISLYFVVSPFSLCLMVKVKILLKYGTDFRYKIGLLNIDFVTHRTRI